MTTGGKHLLFIRTMSVVCIIACVADLISLYVFGKLYPGYSQFKGTISSLGASDSPVSAIISSWWIIIGIVFILFAGAFRYCFISSGKVTTVTVILIMIYGIGEGIGSGLFKADYIGNQLTTSHIWHNVTGGFGVTAMLILPLIASGIISTERKWFRVFSLVIFCSGLIINTLFLARYLNNPDNIIAVWKGLWQRLFLLNTYIYLSVVSVIMFRKTKSS